MQKKILFRIGNSTISFLPLETDGPSHDYISLDIKGGMSVSANLREAFKTHPQLSTPYDKAQVLVDTSTILIPEDEFAKDEASILFDHTLSGHLNEPKLHCVLGNHRAVAVFAVNKDIQTVMADHFKEVVYQPVGLPVWQLCSPHTDLARQRLYGYFHDSKVDVFCLNGHRFKFSNTFSAVHSHDALYYLLYAFRELGLKADRDEVALLGSTPHMKWIEDNLKQYVGRTLKEEEAVGSIQETAWPQMPLDMRCILQANRP